MPYIYWDSTYILVVIGAVICMIASARVKTTFNKYSAYRSMSGMTGAQAAERILHAAGIYDVRVQHVSGNLTDHYNPANKTLNLSDSVCNQTSVAAVGVAAHECGHAIQHARGYVPLRLRTAFVPIANFGSMLAWPGDHSWCDHKQPFIHDAYQYRNSAVFVCCVISADYASG